MFGDGAQVARKLAAVVDHHDRAVRQMMLAAGQPVGAVALDLGYATASAFIGLFRGVLNETPAAYRQRLLRMEAT